MQETHTLLPAACVGNCKFIWGQSSKMICQSFDQKDDMRASSCLYTLSL